MKRADTTEVAHTLGLGGQRRSWGRPLVRLAAGVSFVALLIAAVRACPLSHKPPAPARFEAVAVRRGDLRATVTATGSLQAVGVVEVGCEISGRIQRVLVNYNSHVDEGQLLAEIDPVQLRAEANQTESQVRAAAAGIAQANATLLESKQSLERAGVEEQERLLSTKDLEAARAAFARAEANLASARAAADVAEATLKSAAWKLDRTKIVSPISGIVLSRSIEPGQTVQSAFTTPVLFKIATDLARLELHVQVDEADIGRVREDLAAEFHVDAYPDRAFSSRVETLHNDSTTSNNVVTYEAVLSVDNAEHLLRPGMTATATIVSESRSNVVLVPNAALRFVPPAEPKPGGGPMAPPGTSPPLAIPPDALSRKHVFVLRDRRPASLFVSTGATDGKNTEVLGAELEPGIEVLTDVLEEAP
jgi:HlyD family secretion protein